MSTKIRAIEHTKAEARPLDALGAAYARVLPVTSLRIRMTLFDRSSMRHAGERAHDVQLEVHVGSEDDRASRIGVGVGPTVDEAAETILKELRGRGAVV